MSDARSLPEPASTARLPMNQLPVLTPGAGFSLLGGVRVLDLTTSIAGPFATQLLADFGAEIIKVERRGSGDDARAWGPPFLDDEALWFISVNRNKRSLALDYGKPEGAAVLRELIAKADVFVLNQSPRVSSKFGLDIKSVRALRSDIIYVSITGFGLDSERSDWPCYDLIAEGYSGVMDLTGEPGHDPQKIGAPAADMLAGQDAALATLAVLYSRTRGGPGCVIDVALVDSMTRFLTCRIVPYLGSGEIPHRSGGKDSVIAIYQTFDTADAPITLGLGNDSSWKRFWTAVGQPERAEDKATASNKDRRMQRAKIVADIAALLKTRPRAHWLSVLGATRIPSGPINRVDEVTTDPVLLQRKLFYCLEDRQRQVPQVGLGIRIDGASSRPQRKPPLLGEHSEEILREVLGYDEAKIDELRRQTII
jgi:crotonobetainyl-CoA:carnitine CoA-transferase CaiB-like acyl-CoA transferase